jgi:ABC-type dipeptide/oligopeptide/nickel transport system permease subunit
MTPWLRLARRFGRALVAAAGLAILATLAMLIVIGFGVSPAWYGDTNLAGGFVHGTGKIMQPPFPLFTTMDVFNVDVQRVGTHFYLLGSDGAGRDVLGLVAHGAVPSMELVAAVVAARLVVGLIAGFLMALGFAWVRVLSDGMGRWISGFPYLMLAIILIEAFTPGSRFVAFIIGMAAIGWRDIARTVADIIEYVRAQPFALGAKALGTGGLTFFRLHVVPFLRPALAVEIPFQASAVLVLLAELGYLQVFLGGSVTVALGGGNSPTPTFTVANQPELGQLLSTARQYILLHQFLPVLVPAVAVALAAFAFELIGVALRSRQEPVTMVA